MPKVTVLLPTYMSERYLPETINSVLAQTYRDFELLAVDDSPTDRTIEILKSYQDQRIRIVQGKRQGLADALNLGIDLALGEYIARIDADDTMVPTRLAKQVAFLDANPNVAVCGGWQQYFGLSTFLHNPPASAAQCRANLLFYCDLCHSTVMLRKIFFQTYDLRYDGRFAAEDFELWTRVLDYGEIANIPEVLGYYRYVGQNITKRKLNELIRQNGQIVAATMLRALQIRLTERQKEYFAGWINPFYGPKGAPLRDERQECWADLQQLLMTVWMRNQAVHAYDDNALLQAIRKEWLSLRYRMPFQTPVGNVAQEDMLKNVPRWSVILARAGNFLRNYRGLRRKLYRLQSKLYRQRRMTMTSEGRTI